MFLTDNPAFTSPMTRNAGLALTPEARLQTRVLPSTSPSSIRPNLFGD
jgi:hypothetical protein